MAVHFSPLIAIGHKQIVSLTWPGVHSNFADESGFAVVVN